MHSSVFVERALRQVGPYICTLHWIYRWVRVWKLVAAVHDHINICDIARIRVVAAGVRSQAGCSMQTSSGLGLFYQPCSRYAWTADSAVPCLKARRLEGLDMSLGEA